MAGEELKSVLGNRQLVKDAMKATTEGVTKKAVAAKKADDAAPAVKDDKPNKFNTPRKEGEALGEYAVRLQRARRDASK